MNPKERSTSQIQTTETTPLLIPKIEWEPLCTAITGTIGSGKSELCRILEQHGACVVKADEICHALFATDTELIKALVDQFGSKILSQDGGVDRSALRKVIQEDPANDLIIEKIIREPIMTAIGHQVLSAVASGKKVFVELPLLFERSLDKRGFKQIVVVATDDNVCIQRALFRGGLSVDEIQEKLSRQWPAQNKAALADIVINNSGELSELEEAALRLLSVTS